MLSQYFRHADSAAHHWLQLWAATHQFRSPKYVHENEASVWSDFLGGRPLLLDGADGKLWAQSSKSIQAMAVTARENWLETILIAKRYYILSKILIAPRRQWMQRCSGMKHSKPHMDEQEHLCFSKLWQNQGREGQWRWFSKRVGFSWSNKWGIDFASCGTLLASCMC